MPPPTRTRTLSSLPPSQHLSRNPGSDARQIDAAIPPVAKDGGGLALLLASLVTEEAAGRLHHHHHHHRPMAAVPGRDAAAAALAVPPSSSCALLDLARPGLVKKRNPLARLKSLEAQVEYLMTEVRGGCC